MQQRIAHVPSNDALSVPRNLDSIKPQHLFKVVLARIQS
jgi:hypothetical protein